MPKQKLGSKVGSDLVYNCLTCIKWVNCYDDSKSAMYRCSKYKQNTIDGTEDLAQLLSEEYNDDSRIDTNETIFNLDAEEEDDIEELIAKVIESNIPVPPDLRIKDSEIPQAKNFYDWAVKPEFAGGGMPPFPRQVEIGLKVYGEYCPLCTDMDWFEDMEVDASLSEFEDRVVRLEKGICPSCDIQKSELVLNEGMADYYQLVGLAGQRAAKTTSTTLWESYNLHRFLKLPNPASVYGLLSTQILMGTFTALTFAQATENVWMPFKNIVTGTPWFNNYHNFLDRRGEELGEDLYQIAEHSIRYRHRNLFYSPSGPSKRTMRGRTRISGVCDEIGFFPVGRAGNSTAELERLDAPGVYNALNRSMFTVKNAHRNRLKEGYNNLPKPMLWLISSPSNVNDFIMTSYRNSLGSKEIYRFKKPTWEFNPTLKREDFDEEFRLDPVTAERDYACNPPIGVGLFFDDSKAVVPCFKRKKPNLLSVKTTNGYTKTKKIATYAEVYLTPTNHPYKTILAVDVGLVNNSFAFSIMSVPEDYNIAELTDEEVLTPAKLLAAGEVMPKNGARMNMTNLYTRCLAPLVDHFNVAYFVSDRWQNAKIATDLEQEYGIETLEYRCSWEDFAVTRELVDNDNLTCPGLTMKFDDLMGVTAEQYPEIFRTKPIDHLAWQFMTVKENTNVTVLKGDLGTDDLFRTVVLGCALLQDQEIVEDLLDADFAVDEDVALGMVRRVGGGGSSGSQAKTGSDGSTLGVIHRR